jgi:hypothetical protein
MVIKKSLCISWLQYINQEHRDFLITLYISVKRTQHVVQENQNNKNKHNTMVIQNEGHTVVFLYLTSFQYYCQTELYSLYNKILLPISFWILILAQCGLKLLAHIIYANIWLIFSSFLASSSRYSYTDVKNLPSRHDFYLIDNPLCYDNWIINEITVKQLQLL